MREMSENMIGSAKLWGVSDEQKDENNKRIFNLSDKSWRETPWNTEQSVSQSVALVSRRSSTYQSSNVPADINNVMSPRSEAGGLGVKMVEYVLGTSPTNKDINIIESRMRIIDLNALDEKNIIEKNIVFETKSEGDNSAANQNNCLLQNGLQDDDKTFNRTPGSRQPSPNEEENSLKNSHISKVDDLVINSLSSTTIPLDNCATNIVEPALIDSTPYFDNTYSLIPPTDSPGNLLPHNLDNQDPYLDHILSNCKALKYYPSPFPYIFNINQTQHQIYRNSQQPTIPVLAQQQQYLPGQQLSIPPGPYPASPYVINPQEPYLSTLIAGPAVVPPYYGISSWGMYPANLIQQSSTAQQRRSLTSSQTNDPISHTSLPQGNQYQIIPAFYDQSGSLVVGNPRAPNGTPLRLISPTPVIINTGALNGGQQINTNNPSIYSSNVPTSLYSSSTTNAPSGLHSNANFSNTFSSLGLHQNSGIPNNNGRRDSFDRNSSAFSPFDYRNGKWSQSYSSIGSLGLSGSLTPPPLSNSPSLSIGPLMGGTNRILSSAQNRLWGSHHQDNREWNVGSENRLRNNNLPNGVMNLNNLLPSCKRYIPVDKPVGRSRLLEDFRAYTLTERGKNTLLNDDVLCSHWGLEGTQHDLFGDTSRNRYPNLQLRDLTNHIVEFSQDQHGSRFIQLKLERASPAEKQMVFAEVLTAAYNLMTDVFGNYVIQKFFEFGTSDQRNTLAMKISGQVLPLALQMYGCRVIQKALECTSAEQQKEIASELDGHVIRCVKDQNGNHVVQKCIECVEPVALQFIVDAFKTQVLPLSTHPYGCRVIQRILEHCTAEQTHMILEELHKNTEHLIQDQYGNYVIQHILENGKGEDKSRIISIVRGKVLQLSQHKFASNVVECSVAHASRTDRAILIEEVCSLSDGPHGALHSMMKDQFANYVIQKMLDVAEPAQRKMLIQKIRPHMGTLRKYTYGKHVISKLEKFFLKGNVSELGPICSL